MENGRADGLSTALFDHVDNMVCTLDLEGRFTAVNGAGERLTGFTEDELLGRFALELIAPEHRDRAASSFQRRLETPGDLPGDESLLVTRDGVKVPIEVRSALLVEGGRPTGVLGVVRDLSERRGAEEALQESEQRFRSAFEFAAIGMSLVSPEGRFLQVNDSLCEIVGYSKDELLALTFPDITYPDDLELDLQYMERLLAGEIRSYQMEKRYFHKQGHLVWVILTVSLVRTSDGSPLHFISQVKDITERKNAQEALASSQVRLAEAQRIAQIGDWRRDGVDQPLTWSQETYRIFGLDPAEGRPTYERLLATVHPDDRDDFERVVKSCRRTGNPYEHEYRIVRPDGEVRWVHGRGELIRENGLEITRGTAQDITERKLAEEEGDRLREELHHSQKLEAVGRLAGGVAHDFNNMLTAIKGYSELLLAGLGADSPLRDEAEQIRRAAEQASALPRQLLAFSRKQVLAPRLIDLNEVVTEATALVRLLLGDSVELVTRLDARAAAAVADPSQVEQVLINLATNARDAMPAGGRLTIETRNVEVDEDEAREHDASPGRYVVVSVSDTGEGMDAETLRQVFDPFFTTKPMGEGSGLGLASAYGITRQSGGFMEARSELGKGAVFDAYFPLAVAPGLAAADLSVQGEPAPFSAATVLLVEDEEIVRDFTTAALERAGFRVVVAARAEEALELCDHVNGRIDVLVSDVLMPGMGGRELADRILARDPETSIVLMSGYTDEPADRGLADGRVPTFLQKPFAVSALVDAVRYAVGEDAPPAAEDVSARPRISCVVADDHPAVLDSVSRFLEASGVAVLARVERGDEALAAIEAHRPDVALLDVSMEPLSGVEIARRIAGRVPDCQAILYTGHRDARLLEQALDAGARGFVLKEAPLSELTRAIKAVAGGGTFVDGELSGALASPRAMETLSPLTAREREVLSLIAEGMTNERAAEQLGISAETVQSHVRNAMSKLEADTRTQAVATALRQQLIA